MGQLRTLQEDLRKLLFIGTHSPGRSVLWGHSIPQHLEVYRNNVQSNWMDTLETDFPLTRQQFAASEWNTLAQRFFIRHPPQHWELNTSVAPFVRFLQTQKIKPFIKELADYEWGDLHTFIHPATPLKGSGVTNPTTTVHVYQHQIFDWVEAGASARKPPRRKPEVLVFYRDTQNTLHIQEADPLMLLFLEHFRQPRAQLSALEPLRRKLLPTNKVPLESVYRELQTTEILL